MGRRPGQTNKVVVTADRTVDGAAWDRLSAVVEGLGAKAELKRTTGEFKPFIAGGDAISGNGGRCSLGFNVVKDGEPYFLTAGHCTEAITSWSDSQGGAEIGTNEGSNFPGNDFGLVKYTSDDAAPQRGRPLQRLHPADHQGGRGDRRHDGDP